MAAEDNPADEMQPTKEEWERYEAGRCPRCEGTGKYQRLPVSPVTDCAVCNGTGQIDPEPAS
jgi:hypothetical protein